MNPDDDARRLTEFGRMESASIAKWIKQLGFEQPTIWHSNKTRAQETAAIILDHTGWDSVLSEKEGLRPNNPVEPIAMQIIAEDTDLVVVGHMPFMSKMASELVTKNGLETYWNFDTCAGLYLESAGAGSWVVCGFTMPSQLPV